MDFAQNWRKRRACARCRRYKVRCEYDNPLQQSCRRCMKAGTKCEALGTQVNEEVSNISRSANPYSSTLADPVLSAASASPVVSVAQSSSLPAQHRIAYLEQALAESKAELARVKASRQDALLNQGIGLQPQGGSGVQSPEDHSSHPSVVSSHHSGSEAASGEELFPIHTLRHPCPITCVVEMGLLTEEQARAHYQEFANNTLGFMMYGVDKNLLPDYDSARRDTPLMALTAIVSYAYCTPTPSIPVLRVREYIEQRLLDQVFRRNEPTPELVQVVHLLTHYTAPQRNSQILAMFANTVSLLCNLGCEEDCRQAFKSDSPGSTAVTRVRTYMVGNASIMAMSFNTDDRRLMDSIPSVGRCCDTLLSRGTDGDRVLVHYVRMITVAREAIESLSGYASRFQPHEAIRALHDRYRLRIGEIQASATSYLSDDTDYAATLSYGSSGLQIHLSLSECALNQIIFFCSDEPPTEMVLDFSQQILGYCKQLVDLFNKVCFSGRMFPQFIYFRPLRALTAMLRLRAILWSRGLELPKLDVEGALAEIKSAWNAASLSSHAAQQIRSILGRHEQWMAATANTTLLVSPESTSNLLSKILRDAYKARGTIYDSPPQNQDTTPSATSGTSQSQDQGFAHNSNHNVSHSSQREPQNGQSAPMDFDVSSQDIEQIMRELFTGL
uniref:ARAD1D16566p n=1 Tax=Blastobotrys adeninivorans TaxID=409370 RepID=A0A060TEQ4_BLAAD